MTRRYYCPDLPNGGGIIALVDTEAQHAIRVMRVKEGDKLTLFDGNGHEAEAIVTSISRRECVCVANAVCEISREPNISLDLAIALPKPDRSRELIERLTELGVRNVIPLIAKRSQRPPSNSGLEKLRRAVIEASKQCGRNHLMTIETAIDSPEFFSQAHGKKRWIAHQSEEQLCDSDLKSILPSCQDQVFTFAIGPEGGWTDEEVCLAVEHGFTPVSLGSRIYRIETAAVVVAANLLT